MHRGGLLCDLWAAILPQLEAFRVRTILKLAMLAMQSVELPLVVEAFDVATARVLIVVIEVVELIIKVLFLLLL